MMVSFLLVLEDKDFMQILGIQVVLREHHLQQKVKQHLGKNSVQDIYTKILVWTQ